MRDWNGRVTPFPADAARRYREAGVWGSLPIGAEFHRVAERDPARTAVVAAEGALTYGELDELTDRLALGLSERGFLPGDRVIVQVTNRLHSIVAWYGMLKAGLIPVCTLAAHRAHEIGAVSRKVGAVAHLVEGPPGSFDLVAFALEVQSDHPTLRHVLVVAGPEGSPGMRLEELIADADASAARRRVEAIQSGISPEDVACFQLSGGTTGIPKLIPRLHAEYWYNGRAFAEASGWTSETRTAHLIPIIHNAGISCGLHSVHSAGGTLVLATAVPDEALPLLAREGATDALIGHGHFTIVDHPLFADAMASMRRVLLSGAKVPRPVFDAFERHDVWVGQTFGMGEGMFTMSTPHASLEDRLTTVGVPISDLDEFVVLDPGTEEEVADGVVGELACRGPYTFQGYFDSPEANAGAFTRAGYFRTGDLVSVRRDGHDRTITIEGRLKDLINRGGEKISAAEVEALLLRHPGITAAALVAMPDERLGERGCAYLVAAGDPLTLDDVREHLHALSLAKFKWPERLEWLPMLPTTPVGKIDKKLLRLRIADAVVRAEVAPAMKRRHLRKQSL